jgi:hypothetical protein
LVENLPYLPSCVDIAGSLGFGSQVKTVG